VDQEYLVFLESDDLGFDEFIFCQVTRLDEAYVPNIGPGAEAFNNEANPFIDTTVDLYRIGFPDKVLCT